MSQNSNWWKGGVIYQIYPRSFMDSRSDGVGDLKGITMKLEYVASLGVDAIWLSPFFTSPMKDFGYDVSDYRNVDGMFGSIDDFKALIKEAHRLDLRVIIDQVISHSSDEHEWFKESRSSRDNPKADWYVWADAKEDGTPPNNWLSIFGGSSWQWDTRREQYYLHNFLVSQPDLNFHNPAVRQAHLDNMRFWLDLGVDGFRLDTVNLYFHDAELRDNPVWPANEPLINGVHKTNPYARQRHVYDISRPENIDFLRELRKMMDEYPSTALVGEIGVDPYSPLQRMAEYTSGGDKLHMAYTFDLLAKESGAAYIRSVLQTFREQAGDAWPCWALSNHDVTRSATRWGAKEDPAKFPAISLAMLMSLRGSVCLYQGEELGLPEAEVPFERLQDPYGITFWPEYKGRDGCRTPMPWSDADHGGFAIVQPWLPVDKRHLSLSVSEQEYHKGSTLRSVRQFINWRKHQPALITGEIEILEGTGDALVFKRSCDTQTLLVGINMTGESIYIPYDGEILKVHTEHGFTGRFVDSQIELPPYQALYADISG